MASELIRKNEMKTYKGFDKNLQCRGFQYEIGREYKVDECKMCSCGFHACETPLKVWDFYPPVDGNRFCEVEQKGAVKNTGANGKCVSTEIKIGEELGISELIRAHVEWCKRVRNADVVVEYDEHGARMYSDAPDAILGSSGDYALINSDSCAVTIGSSGNCATIHSSGNCATIGSSGDNTTICGSGGHTTIGSCGCNAKICIIDDFPIIGSSGDLATISCNGFGAKISSSGRRANIYSIGSNTTIRCAGEDSIVVCRGIHSTVNVALGTWVCLLEDDFVDGKSVCVGMKNFRIDGKKYTPDTWYTLKNGKVIESSSGGSK